MICCQKGGLSISCQLEDFYMSTVSPERGTKHIPADSYSKRMLQTGPTAILVRPSSDAWYTVAPSS
jgi:hypothetical protein